MTAAHTPEEESVYNLIPPPPVVLPKPPMYKSGHDPLVRTKTKVAATMGRPNGTNAEHPSTFLRSHVKEPVLTAPGPSTHPKPKMNPPVPTRAEKPIMGLVADKNYITSNAVEVIMAKAKAKPPLCEEFNYTQRPGFGEVPGYLETNKAMIAQEKEAIATYLRMSKQQDQGHGMELMSEDERAHLLRHLKEKWATLNAAYQKMGFALELVSQVKRKEEMEAQLAQVEKDIRMLQRGKVVVVTSE